MNKKILLVLIFIIIVVAVVYLVTTKTSRQKGSIVSGTFEAKTIDLSVPVPAKVMSLYAEEGQKVNTNDTLVVLDTTDISYQIQVLNENVQSLEAKLIALDVSLKQLQRDLTRIKTLEKESVPVSKVEKMETEYRAKLSEKTALQKQIESLHKQVERLKYQLSQLTLLSPVKGVVQTIYYDVGEFPRPGFPIATIVVTDSLEFHTYVPQTRLMGIHIGDTVDIIPDAYPEKSLRGVIKWIGEEAEYTPRNLQSPDERIRLVYPVKVDVPNPDGEIKSGMTGVMRWAPGAKGNSKN